MQIHVNSFEEGLNKDISSKLTPNNTYREAVDVDIISDGNLFSVKPIIGNRLDTTIISSSNYAVDSDYFGNTSSAAKFNVMEVVECQIKWGASIVKGCAVFIARPKTISVVGVASDATIFEIYLVPFLSNGDVSTVVKAYSKERSTNEYLNTTLDFQVAGDRGIDIIYFTNDIDPPMRLRCDIDQAPYNDEDVLLTRYHNMIPPTATVQTSNGSMMSGTYSFAVRMINSTSNAYTEWSLLSDPVLVADTATLKTPSGTRDIYSGTVGSITNSKAVLDITFNSDIAANFDYYQLAVVKNITGTGVPKLIASTVEPKFKGASLSATTTYFGDEEESEIDISEITIDDAQIKSVKTLSIKRNYLISGNIKYVDLSNDRGSVTIANTSGYSIDTLSGAFNSNFSKYIVPKYDDFYFRDEVYRFAIVYHDEFGNWSFPEILDFSSSTSNEADTGCIDYKFPPLYKEPITSSDATAIRRLQMQINNITNHPTWAKGFAILRAKRKKNIAFQTPVVPSQIVMPLEAQAIENSGATTIYPTQPTSPNTENTSQPPTATLGVIVPKNLRHQFVKHIIRGDIHCEYVYGYEDSINAQQPKATYTAASDGKRENPSIGAQYVSIIFPPNNIYNFNNNQYEPYVHDPSDQLDIVDIQNLKGFFDQFSLNNESIYKPSGALYEDRDIATSTYFIPDVTDNLCNHSKTEIDPSTFSFVNTGNKILEYQEVQAGIDKVTLLSSVEGIQAPIFGDHRGLLSEGLNDGTAPVNQPMAIAVTRLPVIDPNYKFINTTTTPLTIGTTGTDIWESNGSNGSRFTNAISIAHVDSYGTLAPQLNNNSGDPASGFPTDRTLVYIANVTKGLSDFRYGGKDDFHEFIFTGTYKKLSASEVSANTPISVSVRGGDCSYDLHNFKVNDSHYGIPNNELDSGARTPADYASDWGVSFYENNATSQWEAGRPIPYKCDSQQITVLLESEIRASYSAKLAHTKLSSLAISPHSVPIPSGIGDAKTPLLYSYNLDYSLGNSNKIFVPKLKLEENQLKFPSRIQYSDQRIYQSREIGFDRFRVGNIYDLDESIGDITKLATIGDNLYCLQERGFSYLPVKGQVIETADGANLSIRSADVIGTPNYISTVNGSQHFYTVEETGSGVFFVDATNKQIFFYQQGGGLKNISDSGMRSYFNDFLENLDVREKDLVGFYDVNTGNYKLSLFENADAIFIYSGESIVFNERLGKWVSNVTTDNVRNTKSRLIHGNVISVSMGKGNSGISIYQADETSNTLFGNNLSPSISFYVNPEPSVPKVFDVAVINSEPTLSTLNVSTSKVTGVSTSQSSSMNIATSKYREGSSRVPVLRDSNGARMRGMLALYKIDWITPNVNQEILTNVITKYRISERKL